MAENETKPWYCVDRECGGEIGYIIGGELHLASTVDPSEIRTQGNSLLTHCPKCGKEKTWYSSSALVRAMEQLLDASSYIVARRAVKVFHKELTEIDNLDSIIDRVARRLSEEDK